MTGISSDFRDIEAAAAKGDRKSYRCFKCLPH